MDHLRQDLKQAFRALRQNRAFAAAAIAALTLGIGTNIAIFSVVNAVLLRPMSLPDPDRLVYFVNVGPNGSGPAASPAKFLHWSAQTDVATDAAAFNTGIMNLTGGTFPEQLRSGRVSINFLKLMGASFVKGRSFSPEEDAPSGAKAVVITHRLWTTRFSSDPNIVGKTISLSAEPYAVIGVLGPDVVVP